jgi:Holliday junction resolvase-like predicted endonuclease
MSIERNLLISLLKLTKEKPAFIEDIKKEARLPLDACYQLLQKMQNENLLYFNSENIEVNSLSRVKIAVKAASLGTDLQTISHLLCWQEFEEIAAEALKNNGYIVQRGLRFKHGGRRWEIDVVGCRKPLVVCIDCKRWQHAIARSALKKIVDSQIERTHALADSLPNIKLDLVCSRWDKAKFVPAVLALFPSAYKFIYEVPVVPVLQLQDFIGQLPLCMDKVRFFSHTFDKLSHDL